MSRNLDEDPWSEEEYVGYLMSERRRYTWVMCRYGGLTAAQAEAAALQRYPYQSAGTPFRGIVFHDEAWHWAMKKINGDFYYMTHPELQTPPTEYHALD